MNDVQDIILESEYNVLMALAGYYEKQLILESYIMEADAATNSAATPQNQESLINRFINWIKNAVNTIKAKFNKVPPNTPIPGPLKPQAEQIVSIANKYANTKQKAKTNPKAAAQEFNALAVEVNQINIDASNVGQAADILNQHQKALDAEHQRRVQQYEQQQAQKEQQKQKKQKNQQTTNDTTDDDDDGPIGQSELTASIILTIIERFRQSTAELEAAEQNLNQAAGVQTPEQQSEREVLTAECKAESGILNKINKLLNAIHANKVTTLPGEPQGITTDWLKQVTNTIKTSPDADVVQKAYEDANGILNQASTWYTNKLNEPNTPMNEKRYCKSKIKFITQAREYLDPIYKQKMGTQQTTQQQQSQQQQPTPQPTQPQNTTPQVNVQQNNNQQPTMQSI